MKRLSIAMLVSAGFACMANAGVIYPLVNGTFEAGNTSGWTAAANPFSNVSTSCNSGFAAQTTGAGCVTGFAPVDGSYAAYASAGISGPSNTTGEWDDTLSQTFVAPLNPSSAQLTMDYSYAVNGSGSFDGTGAGWQLFAGNTFIDGGGVITNPGPAGAYSQNWSSATFNLSSDLIAYQGQTLTLELYAYAFYDTRSSPGTNDVSINAGFDDVSLAVTTATPEPGGLFLAGLGLLLAGAPRFHSKIVSRS